MATVDQTALQAIRALYDADETHAAALARERAGFAAWRAGRDTQATVAERMDAVIARGRDQASSARS
jgi:hypothetical protein